ncbi:MAG: nucleotidyltransferase domain-containing protein [Candidatus Bathyarchaeota archaeon]|nr:nucleotidyltransferase domain-containing protein [Candidatus Bathyarchaeota archaeon]
MRTISQLKSRIALLMPVLKAKYHVQSLEIFGSYARGEQAQKSDLDLLITFSQPYSLWDFLDVKEFISKKLRLKVHTFRSGSKFIRKQVW